MSSSNPDVQPVEHECYHCGAVVLVVKRSPWDFDWKCDACKMGAGTISWAHDAPPPKFETSRQASLFD